MHTKIKDLIQKYVLTLLHIVAIISNFFLIMFIWIMHVSFRLESRILKMGSHQQGNLQGVGVVQCLYINHICMLLQLWANRYITTPPPFFQIASESCPTWHLLFSSILLIFFSSETLWTQLINLQLINIETYESFQIWSLV